MGNMYCSALTVRVCHLRGILMCCYVLETLSINLISCHWHNFTKITVIRQTFHKSSLA